MIAMATRSEAGRRDAPPAQPGRTGPCPEQELARLCARTQLSPAARARLRRLLDEDLDGDYLLRWAARHGVLPLLHRHLQPFSEVAPPEVTQQLTARAKDTALRNLRRIQELFRVLGRLKEQDIPALPFKGPMLGLLIYGDVALRPFGDLDMLVPKGDLARAEALLLEDGYRLHDTLTREKVNRRLEVEKSYELVRDGVIVELHWDFLHPMHGFYLDPEAVWTRTRPVEMGGRHVLALAPEDLVLYLCAHGSKHFWSRLSWVCDVAEALRVYQDTLHWPTLLERAQCLHAQRMLLLGLTLAHTLLEAPLPAAVARTAAQNEAVQQLAGLARERLFQPPADAPDRPYDDARRLLKDAQFHLLMRERRRDRLPYYCHLLRLAVTPNEKDQAFLDLPPRLSFLYYLLRPVRLLRDAAEHGLHVLRSREEEKG